MVFASENGVEQQALKEHLGRQKRQLKRDKEILKEANVPFTEINDQFVGFTPTTGGINLMIEKEPEKKACKVVQIPQDNTYKNGFRASKPEAEDEDNEYINRKAEEALKALRAL